MARRWLRILVRIALLERIGAIERSAWTVVVDEARAEQAQGRAMEGQGWIIEWL